MLLKSLNNKTYCLLYFDDALYDSEKRQQTKCGEPFFCTFCTYPLLPTDTCIMTDCLSALWRSGGQDCSNTEYILHILVD